MVDRSPRPHPALAEEIGEAEASSNAPEPAVPDAPVVSATPERPGPPIT
ncbi:hypothetical protein [Saccharopolyspora gloriosae]|nr:hypothetical protein [Saccharopolyspora gloriosae]